MAETNTHESNRVAYVFVIDGISKAFVTDESLTSVPGFTTVHVGLEIPRNLPMGVNIRTGRLSSQTVTFSIEDVDGTMSPLFAARLKDAENLIQSLGPNDTVPASLFDKNVGIEKIRVGPRHTTERAVELLEKDPLVEFAEPNWLVEYLEMPTDPPDDIPSDEVMELRDRLAEALGRADRLEEDAAGMLAALDQVGQAIDP